MARKTYVIGHKRRRSKLLIALLCLTAVLLVGGVYVFRQFQATTKPEIKNSAGTSRPQEIPNAATQHFDQGFFAFDLPADWKLMKHDTAPYNLFSYKATVKNADNRYLDIYADGIPLNLAVNKAVRVQSQGSNLSHGMVSENCTTFTSPGGPGPGGGKPLTMAAKWDGVEFICDNDSVFRNVIGTSAPGTVNKVTLTSLTTGLHSFYFVYTDNNSTPDYSIFYHLLESFIVE